MIERIVINNRILNEQGCFLTGINGLGYAGYDVTTIKPVYMYGWNVTHGKPKGFTFSNLSTCTDGMLRMANRRGLRLV